MRNMIQLTYLNKPIGNYGSVFEVRGDKEQLKSIGLDERFYFQCPDKFSLELPTNSTAQIYTTAENDAQDALAVRLTNDIGMGKRLYLHPFE
jgi:hypothetical protein